jgi:hypothetical protein
MSAARLLVIGCVLAATLARADASFEWLTQPPQTVRELVWVQTVGFALIQGRSDTAFTLYEPFGDGLRATTKTITLGRFIPLSDSGYHPPESPEYSNLLRLAVVAKRGELVQIVTDPVRGRTAWLERKHFGAVTFFSELKAECCVQLLHLPGAERIEVHAQPRDDSTVLRAFNPPKSELDRATLEVLEVRGGWMKIGNHFNPLAGEPEGFKREPGWIRMRDERGRLVFWVVNPDSC